MSTKTRNILCIITIAIICLIILFYQIKKVGFHEDEGYTIASSVSPQNGLMTAYKNSELPENEAPEWKTKEYVTNYVSLAPVNYFNLYSVFRNQAWDNHPPLYYTAVHFACILFAGQFTKYSAFIVNIVAFILSLIVIKKLLELIEKEKLIIPTFIFYGLAMGTISMVVFQRMYTLLTFFIILYFYYSVLIYKNNFELDKKIIIKLGITTVLGFLTQYFFAIYAGIIFVMMLIKMLKNKNKKSIVKYIVIHIIYAVIGILLFVPCISHLLFSDRGLTNLGNSEYLKHLVTYLKHLAYAFTIKDNQVLILAILAVFTAGIIYLYKKSKDKFLVLLTIIPSVIFFLVTVKMTSFRELRYIMPVIPFVAITLLLILDEIIKTKYKEAIIIGISVILSANGMIFSKPKFLYENYQKILDIANENKEKSFVYVYDNFFNHMQSIPEMMIYEKTLLINTNKNELEYLVQDDVLSKEDAFILSIKSYMNNEEIIQKIKNDTEFKNIEKLYEIGDNERADMNVKNNLYLVSKK